jgi:hypothetical protein
MKYKQSNGNTLSTQQIDALTALLHRLVDQGKARILVPPYEASSGFWFGGGNAVRAADGTLWLVGRYRNFGDSRTGTAAGARGLELALFESQDGGQSFKKVQSWSKADLSSSEGWVLSIEGACLHFIEEGKAELFVSTEKEQDYPNSVRAHQKPGTGVWSIDVFTGENPSSLDLATLKPVLADTPPPEYLHVKDPVVLADNGADTVLAFCGHPFSWSSANTGYAVRERKGKVFQVKNWEMAPRGPAWDVAGTRVTGRLRVPQVGRFAGAPPVSVYFYDGLECYRLHEQSASGVSRPRGYSCEEIAGAFYGFDEEFPKVTRLSMLQPFFVSPHGTGCCRYIDVVNTGNGLLATWQQSQPDFSQPLVGHFVEADEVNRTLSR